MQYVRRARNGSRACNKACSRARNRPIVLSTLSTKEMANSIEGRLSNKPSKEICCTNFEKTILSDLSILSLHPRAPIYHLVRNRPAKALYQRPTARRRSCIYTDRRGAAYSWLHVGRMTSISDVESKIYRPAKASVQAIWLHTQLSVPLWLRPATGFARSGVYRHAALKQVVEYIYSSSR